MFSYSKKTFFIANLLNDNNLTFSSEILVYYKNYLGFQHYAVGSLNNLAFSFFKTITAYPQNISKFKTKQTKLYNSQIRFWLNDFYLNDNYSNTKFSSTMIQCSKLCRLNSTNFKF